ncbi:hypothetical protein [Chryseobacterium sp. sg2396]|uniref:hypothetical protein n=1 Tax=Chryseobacterium sp. sg2396 TaxID=3276280 RepID=UPI0025D99ABB|nr:hypothetical protein [uncultured Chryseobacterium sp.]
MKKNLSAVAALFFSATLFAQVGINNSTPKATMDIAAKTTDGSKPEGLIAPRLTGDQIKSADAQYGSSQKGAVIYATVAVNSPSTKTANITSEGYYYFDGSLWKKLGEVYTADNGLSVAANNIVLGGNLLQSSTITNNGKVLQIAGSSSTTVFDASGMVGIGTSSPSTKLEINNGNTAGAIKIVDGTQGAGKFLVSDANGVGTWKDTTGSATIINSTAGASTQLDVSMKYVGASAIVNTPGYYIISPRLITDKNTSGCSQYIAYNLSKSSTTNLNEAFFAQDVHMAAGPGEYDFIYTSNIAYLTAGTYYMLVRYSGGCTSNVTRNDFAQNSFTLTLLK